MGWKIEWGDERSVETAFWSKDGKQVSYAMDSLTEHGVLDWSVYDIADRSTSPIASPYKYDKSIWKRLNVPEPDISPEINGLISPSGQYILYTTTYGNPPFDPDPNARVEIWLADTNSLRKTMLIKNWCCVIPQAVWLPDESKVIYGVSYEGPISLDIVDIRNGTSEGMPVSVTDFMALSPDGTKLAVYGITGGFDGLYGLLLTSVSRSDCNPMDIIVLDEMGWYPFSWSQDSRYLYYWAKPIGFDGSWIRVYDTEDGSIDNLIDESSIENALGQYPHGDFAVSPDGTKLLFWNRDLLLVELVK